MIDQHDKLLLHQMPPEEAYQKLISLGELDMAEQLRRQSDASGGAISEIKTLGSWFGPQPWEYTEHAFGFIPQGDDHSDVVAIQPAAKIPADPSLSGEKIVLTLDSLHVENYPGGGRHNILFEFYAENHYDSGNEKLHYHIYLTAFEGQSAAVVNFPIFHGLNVSNEGIVLNCTTINVSNEDDEKFLSFLESKEFKTGLKLATSMQPVMLPFSETVQAITKSIAKRNRNIVVQNFFIGLDFNNGRRTGLRLATGSYIAVQVRKEVKDEWEWSDWFYNTNSGRIENADGVTKFDFNYIIFGIRKIAG